MEAVAYSTFRDGLRGYMDRARDNAEPIMVTAKDPSANVIVINARDYDNMIENLYVLSNRELRQKLDESMSQFKSGGYRVHELIEVADDLGLVRWRLERLSLVAGERSQAGG